MVSRAAPNTKPGFLFFHNARSCKEWLKSIPLTNLPQAQQTIVDALRYLNRSPDFVALDRLTCMERLREKVSYLLSEQRIRYVGKTIPLANSEIAAWNVSNNLISEMDRVIGVAGSMRRWKTHRYSPILHSSSSERSAISVYKC